MYRPDEEDIDNLSREAAEHYNAPGKPSWDAMRAALDKELPQEKEKKRRGFLFFFLVGLLGLSVAGTGIWMATRHQNSQHPLTTAAAGTANKNQDAMPGPAPVADKNLAANKTDQATVVTDKNTTENNIGTAVATTADKNIRPTRPAADNHLPAEKASSPSMIPTAKSVPVTGKALPAAPGNSKNIAKHSATGNNQRRVVSKEPDAPARATASSSGHLAITTGNKTNNNRLIKNRPSHTNNHKEALAAGNDRNQQPGDKKDEGDQSATGQAVTATTNSSEPPATIAAKTAVAINPVPAADTVANKPVAAVTAGKDSAKAPVAKTTPTAKKDRAILLGITAGMDLSTVKFAYGSNIGYNIGLIGGYQFGKHWSAYTGIVYTKKNYKLNGSDYHPPKDYWTNMPGVVLQTVEGYCRMWELPVTARYTFNPSAKTAFFVGGGLSSYFMKKQEYEYTYKTGGWAANSTWSDDANLNHIFSILDLSAGFQRQMGKHISLQAEPYAKIPLGGVGFGNIRLSSFGLNLTVQYRQPVKR